MRRSSSARSLIVVLASIVGLGASVARAQGPVVSRGADPAPAARALFERGVELEEAGQHEEALDLFRRSFVLVPRYSTSYNVALLCIRANRIGDAILAIEVAASLASTGPEQAAVVELRAQIRPLVAVLVLQLEPAHAVVSVDGVLLEASGAERTVLLAPGEHRVLVEAEGFRAVEHAFILEAETERAMSVTLSRAPRPPVETDPPELAETPPVHVDEASSTPAPSAQPSEPSEGADVEPRREGPSRRIRRRRWLLGGAAAVLFLAGGSVAAILVSRRSTDTTPDGGTIEPQFPMLTLRFGR